MFCANIFTAFEIPIAVITVAPAVKYSFVSKGMQTRRTGQHKAKLTLSPRLHVKPLITVITAIVRFLSWISQNGSNLQLSVRIEFDKISI